MIDAFLLLVGLASVALNFYLMIRVWWLKKRLAAERIFQDSIDRMLRATMEAQRQSRNGSDDWPEMLDGRAKQS